MNDTVIIAFINNDVNANIVQYKLYVVFILFDDHLKQMPQNSRDIYTMHIYWMC